MFQFTPLKALLVGGVCYGAGVYYMSNYYYKRSALREIYVSSDPNFGSIKIMQPRDLRV